MPTLREVLLDQMSQGVSKASLQATIDEYEFTEKDLDKDFEIARNEGNIRVNARKKRREENFVGPGSPYEDAGPRLPQAELNKRLVESAIEKRVQNVMGMSKHPTPQKEVAPPTRRAPPPEWQPAIDPSNPEALPIGIDAATWLKSKIDGDRYGGMRLQREDYVTKPADEEVSLPTIENANALIGMEEWSEAGGSSERSDILQRKEEAQKEIDGKQTVMRGGIIRPLQSAKMLAGAAMGGFESYVDVARDPDYARKVQDAIVETAIQSRKKELKENDWIARMGNDAAKIMMGAIEIVSAGLVGVPLDRDEDVIEAGRKLGINIPNTLAATVRAAIDDPEGNPFSALYETATAAPITTALTVWPMVGSSIIKGIDTTYTLAAKKLPLKEYANNIKRLTGTTYAGENIKRFLVDALDSRNPATTALLDDIIEQTAKIEGGFEVAAKEKSAESLAQLSTRLDEGATAKGGKPLTLKERFESTTQPQDVAVGGGEESLGWLLHPDFNSKLGRLADFLGQSKVSVAKKIADGDIEGFRGVAGFNDEYSKLLRGMNEKQLNKIDELNSAASLSKMKRDAISSYVEDSLNTSFSNIFGKVDAQPNEIAVALFNGERPPFLPLSKEVFSSLKERFATIYDQRLTDIERMPNARKNQVMTEVQKNLKDANNYLDRMKEVNIGKTSGFAEPAVISQVAPVKIQSAMAEYLGAGPARLINYTLNTFPKAVALPLNQKAAINNLIGNATMMPLLYGDRIPLASELIDIAKKVTRGVKSAGGAPEDEMIKIARRNGVFNNDVIAKDVTLMESGIPGKLPTIMDTVEGGTKRVAEIAGKPSVWGDEISKLYIFTKEYPFAQNLLSKVGVGESITMNVSPSTSMKLIRNADGGWDGIKIARRIFSKNVETGKARPLSTTQVEDVVARYAKNVGDNFLFDYGRVPGLLKLVRSSPLIGPASPFFTWSWKALAVPHKMLNPRGITSTSSAVNMALGAENLSLTGRRLALIDGLKHIADEGGWDEEGRRLWSPNPQQPGSLLIKAYNDPEHKLTQKFSASSVFDGVINLFDLGRQAYDATTGGLTSTQLLQSVKELEAIDGKEDKASRMVALQKRVEEEVLKKRDPVSTLLETFGMGGSLLLDEYVNMRKSEAMGEVWSPGEAIKKIFYPSILKTADDMASQKEEMRVLSQMNEGAIRFETVSDIVIRKLTGLGYQSASDEKQLKRLKAGIKNEAQKLFDLRTLDKRRDFLESKGLKADEKELNSLEEQIDAINEVIEDVLDGIEATMEGKFKSDVGVKK